MAAFCRGADTKPFCLLISVKNHASHFAPANKLGMHTGSEAIITMSQKSLLLRVRRGQTLVTQRDQPGRDICGQGNYRADASEIKYLTHTGPQAYQYETPT